MQALMFHTSMSFGWLSSLHDPGCPSLLPIEGGFRSAKSSNVSMKQLLDDKLEGKVVVRLLRLHTRNSFTMLQKNSRRNSDASIGWPASGRDCQSLTTSRDGRSELLVRAMLDIYLQQPRGQRAHGAKETRRLAMRPLPTCPSKCIAMHRTRPPTTAAPEQ